MSGSDVIPDPRPGDVAGRDDFHLVVDLVLRPVRTSDVDDVVEFSLRPWAPVHESFEDVLGEALVPGLARLADR